MNVETAYGIVDIYTEAGDIDDEITSFVMSNGACDVKQRIGRFVAVEYNIEV